MRRILKLIRGIAALLLSLCFGFLVVGYLAGGAGIQVFAPWISSTGILIGLVHVIGLSSASLFSFVLGICWCAEGATNSRATNEPER
jgi:hypothetical protein